MNEHAASVLNWVPAERARRLIHRRPGELDEIAVLVQKACTEWKHDWGIEIDAKVSCVMATAEHAAVADMAIGGRGTALAWRLGPCSGRIAELLFACEIAPDGVAGEVSTACERDAWSRIAATLGLDVTGHELPSPAAPAMRKWGGAVLVLLSFGGRLLLDAEIVEHFRHDKCSSRSVRTTRPQTPLTRIEEALAHTPYPLEVHLDGCDMELGSLRELRVGDVLRIRQALDAPASVRSTSGVPLFSGVLARSGVRKSVELSAWGAQAESGATP
jgi:hypothetical protein